MIDRRDWPEAGPCGRMRDLLLEADPDALEGRGQSEVAVHVRSCSGCARIARRILLGQVALTEGLSRAAAGIAPDADPARARRETEERPGGPRRWAERRHWTGRGMVWGVVAPLAAAAVAAVTLFQGSRNMDPGAPMGTTPEWALPVLGAPRSGVVVEGGGERVAVLPTKNPDITVVWFIR